MRKKEKAKNAHVKKAYRQPELRIYGEIRELTKNTISTGGEGSSGMGMVSS